MIADYMLDPPEDPPMRECDDCGAWMEWDIDADEDGEYLVFWCECEENAA